MGRERERERVIWEGEKEWEKKGKGGKGGQGADEGKKRVMAKQERGKAE